MSDLALFFFSTGFIQPHTPIPEEEAGGCGHRRRSLLGGAASGADLMGFRGQEVAGDTP